MIRTSFAPQAQHFRKFMEQCTNMPAFTYMQEQAFNLFNEAWNNLKSGEYYDSQNNTQLEYMLQSLSNTEYRDRVRHTIIRDLPHLFQQALVLERPPPFMHILIKLNDNQVNIELQELAITSWMRSNGSEPATFQLLNLIETFGNQKSNSDNFISTIIKNMRGSMDQEMLKAFAYMLYAKHTKFLEPLLKKFASFQDKSVLKDFVKAIGQRAVLLLATIMRPGEVKKLLE